MSTNVGLPFELIAATWANHLDPSIAISAASAGWTGLLDLEYADTRDPRAEAAVRRFARASSGTLGLKLRGTDLRLADALPQELASQFSTLVLTPAETRTLARHASVWRGKGAVHARLLLEAVSPKEAALAAELGFDGVIAKGHEAGGRVGECPSFILLQRLCRETRLPIYAQGGIGLHTAAAAYAAGAAGIVLDDQLLLAREAQLPESVRKALLRMDGSETACLGDELGTAFRFYAAPTAKPFAALAEAARALSLSADPAAPAQWRERLERAVTPFAIETSAWVLGQDAAFAAPLARVHKTVPGILAAIERSIADHIADAKDCAALAPDGPLAKAHGTRFPIAQGPMTRVSDKAEFALEVAKGGALPFLALALMRGPEVERLLRESASLLNGRPWGVGILGFVPADLREEQLAQVRACKPAFALLAGGRPEQAMELERVGIPTYLHVPSPGLLKLFLESGSRRFVFEGRECGGHVGPRTSFVLWEQMVEVLLSSLDVESAKDVHVLFAGGVHDALSSTMVAALAGPLAKRGCKIGVLVGTAYTMTHEAVTSGAVVPAFQQEAVKCHRTALLESGAGHSTRCCDTAFVAAFAAEKRRLYAAGANHDNVRDTLEALNVGRLRIASKGIDRNPNGGAGAPEFITLDLETQRREGLYMIGQVAMLRDRICSIADLHREICEDGAARLAALEAPRETYVASVPTQPTVDVAIVGMGCILPGAGNAKALWENILDKLDAVCEVPEDRWDWRPYYDPDPNAKDKIYSKWGGFIDDVPFDPLRYGIPPNTIKSIEPLQLLALEVVRAALIDAGFEDGKIADAALRRRTSVILGLGGGTGALGQGYAVRASLPALMEKPPAEVFDRTPEWTEDSFPGVLMNVTAGRVANRFDLGGVNFTVDAACGSSLAAVRLAVQELATGTSDMVIVGGCDAFQNPFDFVAFSKTHALSPRGKCHTFDASADGIAISEGLAIVVLRRAGDAVRDGARVYARIKGVGGSSDGRDKSLTAPRPEGQALAVERAYAMAGFSPATVGLIEAHGTGTTVGDRTEVTTLKSVFEPAGATTQGCAIGSVKSMIGHTKCAAGTVGLMKAALALYHKVLPPTINVEKPNPEVNFPESPFYVASETRPWISPPDAPSRRAGVSAFGFGGTNFHVALEEHDDGSCDPDRHVLRQRFPSELFLIGGATLEDVAAQAERLKTAPQTTAFAALARDCCARFSAEAKTRLALIAANREELGQRIDAFTKHKSDAGGTIVRIIDPRGVYLATGTAHAHKVAFLFPGQGAQYPNMLRDLALHFDEVRDAFAEADASLKGKLPQALSRYVFPPPAFSDEERAAQQAAVTQTNVAQPAIGAASVAMERLLAGFGIGADVAAGHSYGEYVALHQAGAFDAATLFAISEARGRCMVEATGDDPGTMASVTADAIAVEQVLGAKSGVTIANRNAPDQTVIAGSRLAVERACQTLTDKGLSAKPIRVACGFHSHCVAPARDRFATFLAGVAIKPLSMPVYSNSTAAKYPDDAAKTAALLADHLVNPVKFLDEIETMHADGARLFVEVGPSSILTSLVGRILKGKPHLAVASDVPSRHGITQLQHLLGQLAVAGVPLSLERLFAGRNADTASPAMQSASLWLVNGAYARPAREPKRVARPAAAKLAPITAPAVSASPAAAALVQHPAQPPRPVPEAPRTVEPGPAATSTPAREPLIPRVGTAQAMIGYQRLMERFLATQQQVMLAYLGGDARSIQPAAALPALAPRPQSPADLRAPARQPAPAHPAPIAAAAPAAASINAAVPPAAEATAVPATNGHAPATPRLDRQGVADALVAMISERTGYPTEMLGLDLNIEADLGIDSIKRVEILGAFRKQHIGELTDSVRTAMEKIVRMKTLREVVDGCVALIEAHVPTPEAAPTSNGHAPVAAVNGNGHGATNGHGVPPAIDPASAPRFTLVPVRAPSVSETLSAGANDVFLITDDETGVAAALAERLRKHKARAVLLRQGPVTRALGSDLFAANLADLAAVQDLWHRHLANGHHLAGLFHCLPLRPGKPYDALDLGEWREAIRRNVKSLFNLAVTLAGVIGSKDAACVVAATRLGGAMGLDEVSSAAADPTHAGIPGLLKTLEKEWVGVRCKSVDFAADAAPDEIAERLLIEAAQPKGTVEIGYAGGERLILSVAQRPISTVGRPVLDIGDRSVILVTGGARGITAEIVRELADRHRPTLILCGSTPEPAAEDATTASCVDGRAIKAVLIKAATARGETPSPAAIENTYHRIMKDREIRETLEAVRRAAGAVEYHQVDVRDEAAFGALIDAIYTKHGRLDGVIHGAGIVEDKLIGDKTSDSFDRVVETKLISSFILSRKLNTDALTFLAFFASVAGTFGNRGQSDYAAANEILCHLALHLDRDWPGRVVAFSWGPWDKTGMVSPEIKRQFEAQGIEAVPPDLGRWAFDAELRFGEKGDAKMVWGNGPWAPSTRALATGPVPSQEQRRGPATDVSSPLA